MFEAAIANSDPETAAMLQQWFHLAVDKMLEFRTDEESIAHVRSRLKTLPAMRPK